MPTDLEISFVGVEMYITWKSEEASSFKIVVIEVKTNEIKVDETVKIMERVVDVQPYTEYDVKVSACSERGICSEEYTMKTMSPASGIYYAHIICFIYRNTRLFLSEHITLHELQR